MFTCSEILTSRIVYLSVCLLDFVTDAKVYRSGRKCARFGDLYIFCSSVSSRAHRGWLSARPSCSHSGDQWLSEWAADGTRSVSSLRWPLTPYFSLLFGGWVIMLVGFWLCYEEVTWFLRSMSGILLTSIISDYLAFKDVAPSNVGHVTHPCR